MNEEFSLGELQNELPIEGIKSSSFEDLNEKWTLYFNYLIQNDFPKMLNLLYKIDISEEKLKRKLKESPDVPAGKIITSMVIERLRQKIRSRKEFQLNQKGFPNDPTAEKW
jgi:hypothetical protein